jgi:hypothetical protein
MYNKALIELQYLPNIQYMSKWYLYEEIILEGSENYSKGGFRNRCMIATSLGAKRLSIPLQKGKNNQTSIREVKIAYEQDWQTQHWRSIKTAYNSAPYFEFYADQLLPFFEKKETFLWDFNLKMLDWIRNTIGLTKEYAICNEFEKSPPEDVADLRNLISPRSDALDPHFQSVAYGQVFEDKQGFLENLSVIDLIFCAGPASSLVLSRCIQGS